MIFSKAWTKFMAEEIWGLRERTRKIVIYRKKGRIICRKIGSRGVYATYLSFNEMTSDDWKTIPFDDERIKKYRKGDKGCPIKERKNRHEV
jgi:hypothetical protein